MYRHHKRLARIIFFTMFFFSYLVSLQLNEYTIQHFVTFFSITFGFYITSIAMLYDSSYIKRLYREEEKEIFGQTKMHTLEKYFQGCIYWALFSIVIIIFFSAQAQKLENGYLSLSPLYFTTPFINIRIHIEQIINSSIYSILSVNIYLIILFLNVLLSGLVEQARK